MKLKVIVLAGFVLIILFPILTTSSERKDFIIKTGVMEPTTDTRAMLKETNIVTMDPSRNPGFCFLVDPPNEKPYEIYSIHYLPQKPKKLTGAFNRYNLAKATQGIKTLEKRVKGIRSFCFDFHEGDPLGEYRIEIFTNKTLQSTLDLEVVPIENS